jgi:hypothetical protein
MKTVTVCCQHESTNIRLRVSERNICCIQCGLIQITLSPAQAARVRRHCHCMSAKLYNARQNNQDRAIMTIDPSQLDLGGELINTWLIG